MTLRVEAEDTNGNPITSINVGQNFQLGVFVQDIRTRAQTRYLALTRPIRSSVMTTRWRISPALRPSRSVRSSRRTRAASSSTPARPPVRFTLVRFPHRHPLPEVANCCLAACRSRPSDQALRSLLRRLIARRTRYFLAAIVRSLLIRSISRVRSSKSTIRQSQSATCKRTRATRAPPRSCSPSACRRQRRSRLPCNTPRQMAPPRPPTTTISPPAARLPSPPAARERGRHGAGQRRHDLRIERNVQPEFVEPG